MTSSAPFPSEPTMEELANPRHGILVELEDDYIRGMVPSFYEKHPNEDITVTVEGVPLLSCGKPFTVRQVPIERRWAVKHNGEVLGELEFRNLHVEWYQEFFRELMRRDPDIKGKVDGGRPDYDVPDPKRFVAVQVDSANPKRFVPANYEPHQTAGAHSKEFFTREGERVEEDRLKVILNAFADPELRAKLRPHELDEVAATLGVSASSGNDSVASKLEVLNDMKAAGDLSETEHSRQVALLTGAPTPEPKAAVDHDGGSAAAASVETNPGEPKTFTTRARCGKEFTKSTARGAGSAVRFHELNCPACKENSD